MERIVQLYTSQNSGTEIISSFESSGTLKTQIEEGAECDIFISAAQKQMNALEGLIDKSSRVNLISFAGNVTEIAMQIREGAVDCGIVYATDAAVHGLKVIAEPPAGTLNTPVIYPAAIISSSSHKARAEDFLMYLQGTEAQEVFASFGFSPAK